MKKNGEPLAFTDATATIIKVAPKIANDKWLQTFFFRPLLRDRKWSLWNRNDKRWNSFLLSSIGVKSWPPYLDNRAGAKLRRMDISCVSDTDKWPPSRYTFTILWMGWLSKLSRAFIHTHRETQKTWNKVCKIKWQKDAKFSKKNYFNQPNKRASTYTFIRSELTCNYYNIHVY